ncbi:MAG: hypothetical protein A2749_01125 [Parcubacteria group bacterium RIFCSPHIGHO2_01_FULL_45_26]|nr:MAG: hypothetical protein A2749_01125 [Parcubacteria group bacterium RIFCSPHIGHO2_01_FULL_45_26]
MIKISKEEIAKRTKNLPLDLQQAKQSVEVARELQKIAQSQSLHVDQIGTVADIVELVLAGAVLAKEFVVLMSESLPELPRDKILALAEEINRKIFAPVQNSLRKIEQASLQPEPKELVSVPELAKPPQTPPQGPPKAPIPMMSEQKIEEVKSSTQIITEGQSRDISYQNLDTRLKMIPEDAKTRTNNDPYREALT